MPPLNDQPLNETTAGGREYWRSLDQIADTPEFREFMHHEFPAGAAEMLSGGDRRQFLKIMAASMALAGLGMSGCRRWPQEKIAPYANRPPGRIPGDPMHYATSRELGGSATGQIVTAMDGRPIKIEGNPQHPSSHGSADSLGQGSILDLYDPDRSRTVLSGGEPTTWEAFASAAGDIAERNERSKGAGLFILSEATSSPSVEAMKARLLRSAPKAKWFEYEPLNNDEVIRGAQMAFGTAVRPQYDLAKASIIVSLDSDFMAEGGDSLTWIRDFAAGRRADGTTKRMNRLYCFESRHSMTGVNADHRVAIRSADVSLIASWLAARILKESNLQQLEQSEVAGGVAGVIRGDVAETLEHVLSDLQGHEGDSVVIAGPRQPAEVHYLAHLMNETLRNVGSTVTYTASDATPQAESIRQVAEALDAGQVDTLVMLGGNPVFDAPADLDFAAKLSKADTTVHLSLYTNETSSECSWHVNRAHYLESWGDARAWDGTICIQQPLIMPLFGGRTETEVLAALMDDDETEAYDIVRRTFRNMTGASDNDRLWRRTLHDGVMAGSALTKESRRANRTNLPAAAASLLARWSATDRSGIEVVFAPDYSVYDGRFANNGWLQELPDPITKLTWDNAAILGPQTADGLGVSTGDFVQVTVGNHSITAPAFILPGQAEGSVTLPLGYGRRMAGRICAGAGFDAYPLRRTTAMGFASGGIQKGRGTYPLATTQDHHAIDVETVGGRGIQTRLPSLVREGTLEEYRENPHFAGHRTHVVHRLSLWEGDRLANAPYAWGMSIDLSTCIGCNACVIACQAENNIPIVGKDQVLRGREMHWIRVDRYFKFGENEHHRPDASKLEGVVLQPVPCMQCENAPCEQVCPVAATVHDEQGLNVMVYNRCIGTRYCSNNCPYKVRRFNYFDFRRREPYREQPGTLLQVAPSYYTKPQASGEPLEELQYNPEVTVRVRGVMEKCTYCVQRIERGRIDAKNDWVNKPLDDPERQNTRVPIADGTIVTACQQTCPAEAIIFGDLNDPNSRVAKLHGGDRSYEMLEEIHTKPRTRYLAKLRNPAFRAETEAPSH